jgi:ribose-phosphate pyrophosphokinase
MVPLQRAQTVPASLPTMDLEHSPDEYTDERAREVITGRLYQGHIVDDDFPSPLLSTLSGSVMNLAGDLIGPPQLDERDPMASSFMSTASSFPTESGVNGRFRSADCSDKEEEEELNDPAFEHTVTLVGNVNDRTVFIIDDMMDRCESWIAAAETVKKRGGATKVYCIATHGLFGEDSLESMQACDCIDFIIVTNTFPIDPERIRSAKKLTILDMSGMLAEAIRRNHYGECMQQLYQHYQD